MGFFDFIQQSNECSSRENLVKIFETALCEYGINSFIYSRMRSRFASTDNVLHGVACSYPEDWMKHYAANNYLQYDPTYRYVAHKSGVVAWKTLQEMQELSEKEKLVMNEAEDAGLKNGVALALHGRYGGLAGFGFTSRTNHQGLNKNELDILYGMANQFHLTYASFDKTSHALPPIVLTDRQKEVLGWSAAGKNHGEIADILKISETTVNDHFRQIYKKLDCNNRVLAILKSVKLGLIRV
ncbi:MAG: autoinducer binding domain-containing protein [Alphaproteobacteria bacterium]